MGGRMRMKTHAEREVRAALDRHTRRTRNSAFPVLTEPAPFRASKPNPGGTGCRGEDLATATVLQSTGWQDGILSGIDHTIQRPRPCSP